MCIYYLQTYQGEPAVARECCYHPGVPIFHEGLKFWSCCQRKTTDFQSFLNQEGCDFGYHKWKKESVSLHMKKLKYNFFSHWFHINFFQEGSAQVECRHDWHQTATHVTLAIYGKKYDPDSSYVELSPVRLKCHLVFPEQGGTFNMDIELRGVSWFHVKKNTEG